MPLRQGARTGRPQIFATRAAAVRALWGLAMDGTADTTYNDRFRALVLLAAFASLRWGEVTALKPGSHAWAPTGRI